MTKLGNVSGDVTGDVNFKGRASFYQGLSGAGVQVIKDSQVWYVDSGKAAPASSGDGLTWDKAFITIAEALTAAGTNDVIYVAPGDYPIAAALAVVATTHAGLTIIGPNRSGHDYKALVYTSGAVDCMTIDANNVTVIGLAFSAAGGNGNGISIASGTATYKCHIENCRFDGYGNAGYGVLTDDTQDSPDLLVENCLFRSWATGGIYHNSTRATYRNNDIFADAASIGINLIPTGGNRPDTMVYGNRILGSNSTDVGIQIASTEPTDGTLLVANNVVTNCSTNITQDKSDADVVNNGTYGDSAAPVIVDPNA